MPKDTFFHLKPDKQERILRSAIDEFNSHGFVKANVGTIAKNAEVAKGSMYQYFENKNELFVHCVKWSVNYLVQKVGDLMDSPDLDLFEYCSTDIHLRVRFINEEKALSLFAQDVFIGKFRAMPDEALAEMMSAADDYILRLIKAGQEKGSVRTDVDVELLKIFLMGAMTKVKEHTLKEFEKTGFDVTNITEDYLMKFDAIVDSSVDLLKNGIGSKGI